jgi:hypothetical protein
VQFVVVGRRRRRRRYFQSHRCYHLLVTFLSKNEQTNIQKRFNRSSKCKRAKMAGLRLREALCSAKRYSARTANFVQIEYKNE